MGAKHVAAWIETGHQLGIRVTAPFTLMHDGVALQYDALLHDFGSERGMLCFAEWDGAKARAAVRDGFGYSCIEHASFERESTIEVLMDWGWGGIEAARPTWLDENS